MKKYIRIIFEILTIFIFIVPTFVTPVHAKTLGELKNELEQKKQELQENKNKKAETETEISNTRNEIASIEKSINQIYVDMANLQVEIDKLNENIAKKDKEMKDIINFVQISSGESAYLEYAFGATDFTDFIYRMAVSEQLANYNEKLIEQYNQSIEDSKKKQQELTKKQSDMAEKSKQLEAKMNLLGQEIEDIEAVGADLEDTLEYQKEVIALYVSKGCKDNESIATCGREVLPKGTAFYRPTTAGFVISEWGPRDLLGRNWHEGIDISVGVGTTVYSVANGMVAAVVRYDCGGNMVIVHHDINNKSYTSVYAHLSSVAVSSGQDVDRNTIIGYSGGTAGGYDKCTTGAHLHVTIATGHFLKDYNDWLYELNKKYSINPRTVINFPAGLYNRWSDRLTKY